MSGVILIVVGLIAVVSGILLITKSAPDSQPEASQRGQAQLVASPLPSAEQVAPAVPSQAIPVPEQTNRIRSGKTGTAVASPAVDASPEDEAYEKGLDFEKFVVTNFSKKYFKVIDWTGDKAVDGIYAESSKKPDLLMEYKGGETARFFVECKWKGKLYKGGYQLCRPDQLSRYQRHASSEGVPVFIVAGLGGSPSQPAELYCVPLEGLTDSFLSSSDLQRYRKNVKAAFFFDTHTQSLR